jgi:multiple sugar transport system substrate-binding protein
VLTLKEIAMKVRRRLLCSAAALLSLALAGCTSGMSGGGDSASGEVRYWLWDSNQLPAYQDCANAFQQKNPDVKVKVEQVGWDDYWNNLNASFVAGNAPDVFTDHLGKFGEFVKNHQIEPLDDLVKRDHVDTNAYFPGLADLWVGPDSARYGLPKDWDTVGVFYNKKMAADAGVADQDLATMTWNPNDGGTLGKILAKLSVDKNGKHGDQPGFDPKNVKTYGLGYDGKGAASGSGQVQWSWLAASNGFGFTDKNPWGTKYHYSDPSFVQTMTWFQNMIKKGYIAPLSVASGGVSDNDQFGAGSYATVPEGDWMISSMTGYKGIQTGIAPLPTGPSGKRASMFNGLADSIWSGSQHKEAAWKWVKFLASADCQNIVGNHGVVFPALPSGTDAAKAKYKDKGIDVTPFTVNVDDKTTFPFPITDHASQITEILQPTFDSILSLQADPASALQQANQQINALFQ